MKKSKFVTLVLITAGLASCHKQPKQKDWESNRKVYMRSDESADYNQANNNWLLWYFAFRPYGFYNGHSYQRSGYYSSGINSAANTGHNAAKSSGATSRGGFGGRGFSVSS